MSSAVTRSPVSPTRYVRHAILQVSDKQTLLMQAPCYAPLLTCPVLIMKCTTQRQEVQRALSTADLIQRIHSIHDGAATPLNNMVLPPVAHRGSRHSSRSNSTSSISSSTSPQKAPPARISFSAGVSTTSGTSFCRAGPPRIQHMLGCTAQFCILETTQRAMRVRTRLRALRNIALFFFFPPLFLTLRPPRPSPRCGCRQGWGRRLGATRGCNCIQHIC